MNENKLPVPLDFLGGPNSRTMAMMFTLWRIQEWASRKRSNL